MGISPCEGADVLSIATGERTLLVRANGKKGLEDRLVATYRAFTGGGETVALDENEAAGTTLGGSDVQDVSARLDTETNVFQMAVNFFLRNVSLSGDLPGGERLIA